MIRDSKQQWAVGETVKVGFLKLRICAIIPTPGDYRPDRYALTDTQGRFYTFTPHRGLARAANLQEAVS